ncbi:hypothetical protein NBRC10512_008157 [Rhodotorula toruloides]
MQPHRYTPLRSQTELKPALARSLLPLQKPRTHPSYPRFKRHPTTSTAPTQPHQPEPPPPQPPTCISSPTPPSPQCSRPAAKTPRPPPSSNRPTSGFWSHIPLPRPDPPTPTQYAKMPIIEFEPTASEADKSWADETKEAFPSAKTETKDARRESESEGGKEEKWKKVERTKKREMRETAGEARNRRGEKTEAKRVSSRARRTGAPASKEELRAKDKNLLRLRKKPNICTTDLLLIQEPPRPLKPFDDPNWRLVTPPPTSLPDGEPAPTRNLILITTRLGPAVATQVAVDSGG